MSLDACYPEEVLLLLLLLLLLKYVITFSSELIICMSTLIVLNLWVLPKLRALRNIL